MKTAACVLIFNAETNKVVLVNRRGSTEVGMPGGKVDPGERAYEAAIRETFEETGIELNENRLYTMYAGNVPGEDDYYTESFLYWYDGDIPGGQESDIVARWGDLSELLTNSPFIEFNKSVIFSAFLCISC